MTHVSDWVVLSIAPEILWSRKCAFCEGNAASGQITQSWGCKKREEAKSFADLFSDYHDGDQWHERRLLGIPANYTTNPQAEILCFDTIPLEYIRKTYVEKRWPSCEVGKSAEERGLFIRSELFEWRSDWKHWKRWTNGM